MAKAKKKELLTPEERLQAALVPDWEQPYKVPENWIYFYFTSLIDIEGGTQPPKNQFIDEYREGYIRLVQIRDFSSDKYIVFVPDSAKLRHFNEDDILVARYGASLGRICTGMSGAYNVALAKTIFSSNILNRKYVYWMLQSESFQVPLMGISRTAQAGFNKDDLSTFAMPLPPLPEQQRIVDRIDSLFAKLDEAKQKAQDTLDSFETRKAAILYKAFAGELTAKWRKEHGVGMESWKHTQFDVLTSDVRLGLVRSKAEQSYENLYPYLKMNNITSNGTIDIEDVIYADATEDEVELFTLQYGDFLFNTRNSYELVGKNAVWNIDSQKNVLFNNNIMRVRFNDGINPFLVSFYLNSEEGKRKLDKCKKNTTNIAAIYAKNLNQIQIPIMSESEQTEIVRILDDLLAKEQQAKDAAEAVLEQIDLIKKAILARAFRGELGTNDPSEESAVELLHSTF